MSLSLTMKLTGRTISLFFVVVFTVLLGHFHYAAASTVVTENVTRNSTWILEGSPYIVDEVAVTNFSTLTIQAGVVVKFLKPTSSLTVNGENFLRVNGTESNKVYFTSIKDDLVGGDASGDGDATTPLPRDWAGLIFRSSSDVVLSGAEVRYPATGILNMGGVMQITNSVITHGGESGITQINGQTTITNTEISHHPYGIVQSVGDMHISNSDIKDNASFGIYRSAGVMIAQNNFWGDASGPFHSTNDTGLGNAVSDGVVFDPWLGQSVFTPIIPPEPEPEVCIENCFSNVMFLPGMMGTRLYDEIGLTDCIPLAPINSCFQDRELWLSLTDEEQALLGLDENGKSLHDLYTKDDTQRLEGDSDETGIIEEAESSNIYSSFTRDLKDWKTEGTIADYAFIPYDWRLSLDDIITNGHVSNEKLSYTQTQDFSESFILKKLEALVLSSKSGKVTIVAHSNGGLVTKALIQKLKDTGNPLYDKIDKIIFVAVPQVGTPEALVALTHGLDMGPGGLVMSNERSRQISENMPVIYNLLPSASYFTTVVPVIPFAPDKLITFQDHDLLESEISHYGTDISGETELKNYILGTDGRVKPILEDILHPNIGNSFLYDQAQAVHQILDNWQPSTNTKVIQVAGWGEETIAGLNYTVKHGKVSYKPRMVVDGDHTVVTPSALWIPESTNVERWWVDLQEYNEENAPNRVHKNILEIDNIRNFIKSKIQRETTFADPENILLNSDSSLASGEVRLHYILHSPLTLGITDAEGKYTGMNPETKEIKQEIPGVDYRKIGDVQFISTPTGVPYTLKLDGYAEGNFSLDVEKQEGNTIIKTKSFDDIPNTGATLATMDIGTTFDVESAQLKVDEDGDGDIDKVYPEIIEEEILPVENTPNESDTHPARAENVSSVVGLTFLENKVKPAVLGESSEEVATQAVDLEPQPSVNQTQKEESNSLYIQETAVEETKVEQEETADRGTPESAKNNPDTALTAAVTTSGVKGNWIWYGIILVIVGISLFIKKFFKS